MKKKIKQQAITLFSYQQILFSLKICLLKLIKGIKILIITLFDIHNYKKMIQFEPINSYLIDT